MANRIIFQGAQEYAGYGPVSIPEICRRRRLDRVGGPDRDLSGNVPVRSTPAKESHRSGPEVVATPTHPRRVSGDPTPYPASRSAIHCRPTQNRWRDKKIETTRRAINHQRIQTPYVILT